MPHCTIQQRKIARWLFLLASFLFMLTSSGRVRFIDEVLPVYQTESLVARGSTAIPQAVGAQLFYGKRDLRGQPQAPYPPGQAIVAIPWYLAGRHVLLRLPGVPANAQALVTDFAVVLSNATFTALATALAFLIFLRLGVADQTALLATAIFALGTPLWAYAAWYYSEPLAVALFLGAALLLLAGPADTPLPLGAGLAGGALLGAALWVRPTHVVVVAVFLLALAASGRRDVWRVLTLAGSVIAVFGVAYLARNSMLFGNAFDFGYPDAAEAGKRLNTFETPLGTGLYAFLLSPGKSIFLFAPPLLLALGTLPKMWRRNPGLAVAMGGTLLATLPFFACYTQFEGGYSFGPRYMVPGIALACLGIGVVLSEGSATMRKALVALAVAGFLINCVGLATSPLEDQATGKYYDANFNYRLDYNPIGGQGGLLWHYLTSSTPAPIGRGWDRWFVFLRKGGVGTGWLLLLGGLFVAGALVSARQLRRVLQQG